jgi:Holliday junction resolvase RusA-like endonuclease
VNHSFTIYGTLPGLNDIVGAARTHWSASASQKKNATEACADAAKALPVITPPVRVKIVWFEPNERRDVDNIVAASKFVLDGVVAAGKLPDDNRKNFVGITHAVVTDRKHPRIVVEIEEVN